jgi:hypothetical protein
MPIHCGVWYTLAEGENAKGAIVWFGIIGKKVVVEKQGKYAAERSVQRRIEKRLRAARRDGPERAGLERDFAELKRRRHLAQKLRQMTEANGCTPEEADAARRKLREMADGDDTDTEA